MARTFSTSIFLTTSIRNSAWKAFKCRVMQCHSQWTRRCICTKVDTKNLSNLRKQTGYGLSLCREALLENQNDVEAANMWLCEQATKQGWQKAEKLQARKTGEGLVGVLLEGNHAAMVEVCCETDFVAQNEFFKQLVARATATALHHRKMIVQKGLDLGGSLTHFREVLLIHKLKEMVIPSSSETLNDAILHVIGRLGERVTLRRAVTMTTDEATVMGCYTHGHFTFNVDNCAMGKYAALVAVQPKDVGNNINSTTSQLSSLATRLTQHIVGMNPSSISLDEEQRDIEVDKSNVLLEQPYLMDEGITVGELLKKNNAFVVDFLRLECGNE